MYMQALQDYIVQQLHLLDSDLLDQDHLSAAADVVAVEKELAIVIQWSNQACIKIKHVDAYFLNTSRHLLILTRSMQPVCTTCTHYRNFRIVFGHR